MGNKQCRNGHDWITISEAEMIDGTWERFEVCTQCSASRMVNTDREHITDPRDHNQTDNFTPPLPF